jgi:hypothetical protein
MNSFRAGRRTTLERISLKRNCLIESIEIGILRKSQVQHVVKGLEERLSSWIRLRKFIDGFSMKKQRVVHVFAPAELEVTSAHQIDETRNQTKSETIGRRQQPERLPMQGNCLVHVVGVSWLARRLTQHADEVDDVS